MTSFEVPLAGFPWLVPTRRENPYPSYGISQKNIATQTKGAVGESNPRPLPPEGRIIPLDQRPKRKASNEDRTRDLVLTRHMLCQLSYRGDTVATGWRANTQRARQSHQKSAKEHTRRDSNPQPPDSKSGALSIAPRVPAANARDRCCNHAVELRK